MRPFLQRCTVSLYNTKTQATRPYP